MDSPGMSSETCKAPGMAHKARNCIGGGCADTGRCCYKQEHTIGPNDLQKPARFIDAMPQIEERLKRIAGPITPTPSTTTERQIVDSTRSSAWLKQEVVEGEASVAAIADQLVNGERQSSYGHPYDNHARIADLWNAYISGRHNAGQPLTPQDVCILMILLKVARLEKGYHRDSVIDTCGYAKCLDMIETEAKRRAVGCE